MIGVLICLAIFLVPIIIVVKITDDTVMAVLFTGAMMGVIVMLVFVPIVALTGGLLEGYSDGYREGYITKVSQRGVVFKTFEGQMQIGTGQQAALQEPFEFSISDPDMAEFVESYLGEKVRLKYKQWLIMPYWVGSSGYDIVEILPANDD